MAAALRRAGCPQAIAEFTVPGKHAELFAPKYIDQVVATIQDALDPTESRVIGQL